MKRTNRFLMTLSALIGVCCSLTLLAGCNQDPAAESPNEKTAAPARTQEQINNPNEPRPGMGEGKGK